MRHSHLTVVLYLLAALGASAHAAILRVKSDAPGPARDGTSWATAFTAVQPALDAAASSDEVWVVRGTYTGAITMKSGVALYGGFAGAETARNERDFLHNETVLDGTTYQEGNQVVVSTVTFPSDSGNATILDGFTVTNGAGTLLETTEQECGFECYTVWYLLGGGIHVAGGTPVVRNNRITRNMLASKTLPPHLRRIFWRGYGGGVYVAGGSPRIETNVIAGNWANRGGGIHVAAGDAAILRNQIVNNIAVAYTLRYGYPTGVGGGLYAVSAVSVAGNVIARNEANDNGSAVALNGGGACLSNTIVRNNVSTDRGGADVFLYRPPQDPPSYTFANNIIANNSQGLIDEVGANYVVDNRDIGGSTVEPPKFVDPDGGDYHLMKDSPCVDTGDDAYLPLLSPLDVDGEVRKSGARIDYGADEVLPVTGRAVWVTQPVATRANVFIQPAPVVKVVNGDGQTMSSFQGRVTLALQPGVGAEGTTLAGSTAMAVNGVATFPSLAVTKPGTGYVLVATAKTLYGEAFPADASAPFDVLAGATRLRFQAQPVASTARVPFVSVPVVAALDDTGALVTEFSGPVTLSIKDGTGTAGAQLLGTATVSAVGGLATFDSAAITKPGSGYVLVASNPLLLPAESEPVSVGRSGPIRVRTDGNDANHGATWDAPFRTVQAALDTVAEEGGGEIWVAAGTYAENISIETPTALYGGFAGTEATREERSLPADLTVLDGRQRDRVVTVSTGIGGVTLDAVTIRNGLVGSPVFAGNGVYDRGGALFSVGNAVTVTRCVFDGNTASTFPPSYMGDLFGAAISLEGGTAVIRSNTFTRNHLSTTGGVMLGSIYCKAVDATVERNTFLSNDSGIAWEGGTVDVRNNLLARNYNAISASGRGVVANNTIVDNTPIYDSTVSVGPEAGPVVNNIIAFSGTGMSITAPSNVRNNILFGNARGDYGFPTENPYPEGQDPNIKADPLFADRANGDYHLLAGSPAIDAGDDAVYVPGDLDLDGYPRRIGAHIDIGAYEFATPDAVTMEDARRLLKIAAGLEAATTETGPVDLSDALSILRKVTGQDTGL